MAKNNIVCIISCILGEKKKDNGVQKFQMDALTAIQMNRK